MGTQSGNSSPSATLHPHHNASVTTTAGTNAQAPQIKLDKTLEEAAETGILRLNGRKLKEISLKLQSLPKYDITDTIVADLSKNRLNELPSFVCELSQLTELSLYSNLLRNLPSDESLLTLQHLTYINLSKNQISVIPRAICFLPKLQVLIISHNRLCSLPEEVGRMESLSDLDVSCNEISFLPAQLVNMANLKYLDLRRNILVELPADLHKLTSLTRLDISENRIQSLPLDVRKMLRLTEFICDHNPLVTPPAALCTRGLNHVRKFLENEERKRGGSALGLGDTGILTQMGHRTLRSRESFHLTLRHPISKVGLRDSGCATGDGSASYNEKRFSGAACKDDVDAGEEMRRFAAQRMEFSRSPKKPPQPAHQRHQSLVPAAPPSLTSFQCSSSAHDLCTVSPSSEASTLQATTGGQATPSTLSPGSEFRPIQPDPTMLKTGDGVIVSGDLVGGPLSSRYLTPEEEFRQRREAIIAKQKTEVKRTQKDAVIAFAKQRQSPLLGSGQTVLHPQQPPPPPPPLIGQPIHPGNLPGLSHQQQQQPISPTSESTPPLPNFTIRRGLDRAREEQELLSRMRAIIETRLKMTLPENLAGALTDGVVLCHLANNVRPRSVATIHVPSAANPKLTMAKCRRNVENFLDACRRLGVPPEETCESGDVLAEFDAHALLTTVEAFIRIAGRQSSAGSGSGSTKPTAKPPPPPPPVRLSSDPAYTGVLQHAAPTGNQHHPLLHKGQQAVNNNLPKTNDESPKQNPVGTVHAGVVQGGVQQGEGGITEGQIELKPNAGGTAPGAMSGLGAGVRSAEAVSRNESPVSTSEDISNLENLEYDPLEVRLSSSKATPSQHSSGDGRVDGFPVDTALEDEAAPEGNTTFRSVPADQPGSQGSPKHNTVQVARDERGRNASAATDLNEIEPARTRRMGQADRESRPLSAGHQPDQPQGPNSSVRKLRCLFEKAESADHHNKDTLQNQKGSSDDLQVGLDLAGERSEVRGNGHHPAEGLYAEGQIKDEGQACNDRQDKVWCNEDGANAGGSIKTTKDESFFTTNVKAGIGSGCAGLVLYLYAYHPWIIVLLIAVGSFALYKYFVVGNSTPSKEVGLECGVGQTDAGIKAAAETGPTDSVHGGIESSNRLNQETR